MAGLIPPPPDAHTLSRQDLRAEYYLQAAQDQGCPRDGVGIVAWMANPANGAWSAVWPQVSGFYNGGGDSAVAAALLNGQGRPTVIGGTGAMVGSPNTPYVTDNFGNVYDTLGETTIGGSQYFNGDFNTFVPNPAQQSFFVGGSDQVYTTAQSDTGALATAVETGDTATVQKLNVDKTSEISNAVDAALNVNRQASGSGSSGGAGGSPPSEGAAPGSPAPTGTSASTGTSNKPGSTTVSLLLVILLVLLLGVLIGKH